MKQHDEKRSDTSRRRPKPKPRRPNAGNREEVQQRSRRRGIRPGITAKPMRLREALEYEREQALEKGYELSEAELRERVETIRPGEPVRKLFARMSPLIRAIPGKDDRPQTRYVPTPSRVQEGVETRAKLAIPEVRELFTMLATTAMGSTRRFVVSILFWMAWDGGPLTVAGAMRALRNPNRWMALAFGGERGSGYHTTLKQLDKVVSQNDPMVVQRVNIRLFRRLAEEHFPSDPSRYKVPGMYPGVHGVVDGKLLRAWVPQRKASSLAYDEIQRSTRRSRTDKRKDYGFVVYADKDGSIYERVNGHKVVMLACIALGLPLVWEVVPANSDEREVLRDTLLPRLFELWPDCPMWSLTGDGYYQHSDDLPRELERNWGIHPVFPAPEKLPEHLKDTDRGVPRCKHGVMQREGHAMWWDSRRRADVGIPRGELSASQGARITWRCPVSKIDPVKACPRQVTKFEDAPMHFPFLARAGTDDTHLARQVLMHRRNVIESIFSSIEQRGIGGRDLAAPKWAGDRGVAWLVALALLDRTARAMVHVDGSYQRAMNALPDFGEDHLRHMTVDEVAAVDLAIYDPYGFEEVCAEADFVPLDDRKASDRDVRDRPTDDGLT